MISNKLRLDLRKYSSKQKAKILKRFFKTGPGEYAQGDIFIGITVPRLRILSYRYQDLAFNEILELLKSRIHEERFLALLILMLKYRKVNLTGKQKIYKTYLSHSKYVNNWDLVDVSAKQIVGNFLEDKNRAPLYELANSSSLWEKRIAIISTFHFIENSDFKDTLKIAKILILDSHDLIQKAVGWMLREVGKRDRCCEEKFLRKYYRTMPRTMLRYAIERFKEPKRQAYLKGRV